MEYFCNHHPKKMKHVPGVYGPGCIGLFWLVRGLEVVKFYLLWSYYSVTILV